MGPMDRTAYASDFLNCELLNVDSSRLMALRSRSANGACGFWPNCVNYHIQKQKRIAEIFSREIGCAGP
jgi:hypothetical protein